MKICHLWQTCNVIKHSSFWGYKTAERAQHPSSIQDVSLHIYKYIATYIYIYVWPEVNIFFLWKCLHNIIFSPQKFTVMTITFPPKFPQLPKYQDWKGDRHTIKTQIQRLSLEIYKVRVPLTHKYNPRLSWSCWTKHCYWKHLCAVLEIRLPAAATTQPLKLPFGNTRHRTKNTRIFQILNSEISKFLVFGVI